MEVFLENLTKKFGNTIAVEDLTLKIHNRSFVVLLGPSGCGKTTTLRMIAGLEEPTEGNIYIGDRLMTGVPPKDRNVALVFQDYALYPHFSVYDNIAFPLKIHKYPKEEIRQKVVETANMLRIEPLLHRKPYGLSGGEAQRVALGRAIVREPTVFLMDEPLSNLDARMRIGMRTELQSLHRRLETTIIYVTHDQVEAMALGGKIALMDKAKLQQYASPKEVYERPANLFAAEFIGSPPMNILDGSIIEKDENIVIDFDSFTYSLSKELSEIVKEKAKTSEVNVGVRPSYVSINNKGIEAGVIGVEPLGDSTWVHLKVGECTLLVEATSSRPFEVNEIVHFTFDEKHMYFFDRKSGRSMFLD